jgi:NADP-dependent aldehyde dehydrogenase
MTNSLDYSSRINNIVEASWQAFNSNYKLSSLHQRATLLHGIAREIENLGDELIEVCMKETNLSASRLRTEKTRTIFQLDSYADACERGDWLEATIDTADLNRQPPKPDLRKMRIPLGPVAVFGAANFPFAYSTAGGDTASALAAGCTVIVKVHNGHINTSGMVASAIRTAVKKNNLPEAVFSYLEGEGNEPGKLLVTHPSLKAVGFTGSLAGGKAIWEYSNNRKEPIPVFAEMSSVNPVFIFPGKLATDSTIADTIASSITLGCGQFCTNPGILVVANTEGFERFTSSLCTAIQQSMPSAMLNRDISGNFRKTRTAALEQPGVSIAASSSFNSDALQDIPTIASVRATDFIGNPQLQSEVFGSFSLLVVCENMSEMLQVAQQMEGQLTSTVIATEEEVAQYLPLIEEIQNHCGRFIFNGVPTGVEVVQGMHHGGPFPASTDSRFTSVGADAIKRFSRPVCFQNWPDALLPMELKNNNPLQILRTVNNELTKNVIG